MSKEFGEQSAQDGARRPPAEHTGDSPERDDPAGTDVVSQDPIKEIGGPSGPDPTRYGDWERRGRCIDF